MKNVEIVVAADEADGIGRAGALPWRLPGDTAFFKRITSETSSAERQNAVIMGRKTYETIPPRFRPLKRRLNVVVTRQADYVADDSVICASSLEQALEQVAAHAESVERVFVIGGGEIYRLALAHPACHAIHLTRVEGRFDCDAHLPAIDDRYQLTHASGRHEEGGIGYVFQHWQRRQ